MPDHESMTMLIVEDDELLRNVVQTMCELWNFDVVVMADGFQATAYLEQNPLPEPVPTFALLDIRMPGPDGHEIGKKIREHPQINNIGIAMMTAWELNRADEKMIYETSGADRIIYKPLPPMPELLEIIEDVRQERGGD